MEALLELDRSFFLLLNSIHLPWLDTLMVVISGQVIWFPLVGYFLWLSYKGNGKKSSGYFLLFLLLALAASDVTSSYILKNTFHRLRPCREADLLPLIYSFGQKCGGKYGFVSSHAANSLCLIVFSYLSLNSRPKFFHLTWIAPLMVSFSRIYLGSHYPGDILGGYFVGTIWGYFWGRVFISTQGASR
jgi:undecaprenyl-diphosphatase